MKIALTQFGGIAPLVHPVNLSDFAAQAAENYRSDGGDLRPLIGPGIVPGVTLGRASDGVIRTVATGRTWPATRSIGCSGYPRTCPCSAA